ncbi:hypothetical protein LPJ75_006721 [Coemansia sp. RSA 2598]|nr:hypothetical protein LPJ75_006721 [Coemansia sp. RSA 2598]
MPGVGVKEATPTALLMQGAYERSRDDGGSSGCCPPKQAESSGCCAPKKGESSGCCAPKKGEASGCCAPKKTESSGCCPPKKTESSGCCSIEVLNDADNNKKCC